MLPGTTLLLWLYSTILTFSHFKSEEALLHYFDPHKEEKKFVPEKKTGEAVTQAVPKQVCWCACTL